MNWLKNKYWKIDKLDRTDEPGLIKKEKVRKRLENGYPVAPDEEIKIRILYPEYKGELSVADVYSELMYARLQLLKKEFEEDATFKKIGIIGKAYQDGASVDTIDDDIMNNNCFVIIILTKDCALKDENGDYEHPHFMDEMNLVKEIIEKNEKKRSLFSIFYVHDSLVEKPESIDFISGKIGYQLTTTKEGICELDTKLKRVLTKIWK